MLSENEKADVEFLNKESEFEYVNVLTSIDIFYDLNVQFVPTNFIVNSSGEILSEPIVGAKSKEELMELINSYLE